jgi:hypothetical protein
MSKSKCIEFVLWLETQRSEDHRQAKDMKKSLKRLYKLYKDDKRDIRAIY